MRWFGRVCLVFLCGWCERQYPKIEHLFDSHVVDDDRVASTASLRFDEPVEILIQGGGRLGARRVVAALVCADGQHANTPTRHAEKVDGANVSVHFEHEWKRICQKRSGVIGASGSSSEAEQFRVFEQFCDEHLELLNGEESAMRAVSFFFFGRCGC